MKKMPKILFLDWNGTLSYDKFWGHLETGNDLEKKNFIKIEKALFSEMRNLLQSWMKGQINSLEICEKINKKTNISQEYLLAELQKSCENMDLCQPEIEKMLLVINKSIPYIVIATDNMDTFSNWTFPILQKKYPVFKHYINSFEIGFMKNEIKENQAIFFEDFLKKTKINIKDCVLLDDSSSTTLSQTDLQYIKVNSTNHFIKLLREFINS
jgi:hypothetical protein